MPKLKTHKGAQKRFKLTGNKKIVYNKANRSHLLTKKSAKRKRALGKKNVIDHSERSRIKKMLPYSF